MNLTITVTNPIIQGSQQLKVEYSTDGVNYTLDSYQTSNTFTTTYAGYTAGTLYYFRFTIVKSLSPLVECDPVVKTYFIPETIYCLDFTAELTNVGDMWYLSIAYTTPSPYNAPCGGYVLEYGTSFPLTSIAYATLPASPLVFPAANQKYFVEIYSLDCSGNRVLCDEFEIEPEPVPCTAAVMNSADLVFSGGSYYIEISLTHSIPAATSYIITYSQANAVTSGVPDPGGSVTVYPTSANPDTFSVKVNPNLFLNSNSPISYAGNITDGCGGTIPFDESIDPT